MVSVLVDLPKQLLLDNCARAHALSTGSHRLLPVVLQPMAPIVRIACHLRRPVNQGDCCTCVDKKEYIVLFPSPRLRHKTRL